MIAGGNYAPDAALRLADRTARLITTDDRIAR